MLELVEVNIDELQPSQSTLTTRTLEYYSQTYPLLRKMNIPEIWENDKKLIIADGHNKLFEIYKKRKTAVVIMHTRQNCGKAYDYLFPDIEEKAKHVSQIGITHITHLY